MPADGLIFGVGTMIATVVGDGEYTFGELRNVQFTNTFAWKKWRGGGSKIATSARLDEITLTGQAEFGLFNADVIALITGGTPTDGIIGVTKDDVPQFFSLALSNPNDGSERTVTLKKCFFSNLGNLGFQQGEFTVPQVQFEAIADENGDVAEWGGFTEETEFDLVVAAPIGTGTTTPATGTHPYPAGTKVTLVAEAGENFAFAGWIGNVANPASATTTIILGKDETVKAVFVAT